VGTRDEDGPGVNGDAPAASAIRYEVVAVTTLMSLILYLDRNCISVIVPHIKTEFHLDDLEVSAVFSAFSLAYALAQVPAGWLGDRLGARAMLTGCVLAWSVCTGLTGLAWGLAVLLVVRLLFGVSQAGAYPIAARVFSLWVPFHRRGLANSMVTLGGRSGNVLAPALTAWLIVVCHGWRPVLGLYALLGAVWAAYFWLRYRNSPAEHPQCNAAEVDLIESSRPPQASNPTGQARHVPWAAMVRSRSLWLQTLLQFASNVAWVFMVTWMPTYLQEVHGVGELDAGLLTSLAALAGTIGCFVGGVASDRLTRRVGLRWGRSLMGIISKVLAALGMLGAVFAPDPLLATLALAFASFTTDLGISSTWAYFQDAGGAYVGTLVGWANMFGNLGATVSAPLLAYLARAHGWPMALAVCAVLFAVAGLCWLGVDARQAIVQEK
jgi:MFS family permease